MNRRRFLSNLAIGTGLMALDPERLLWVPGVKRIFIPAHREPDYHIKLVVRFSSGSTLSGWSPVEKKFFTDVEGYSEREVLLVDGIEVRPSDPQFGRYDWMIQENLPHFIQYGGGGILDPLKDYNHAAYIVGPDQPQRAAELSAQI